MAERRYGGDRRSLHSVDVPDWSFLERVEKLWRPFAEKSAPNPIFDPLVYRARDHRGLIAESSPDALRAALEEEERQPHTVEVVLNARIEGQDTRHSATISMGDPGTFMDVSSEDEAFVTHMETRLRELAEQANREAGERRRAAEEAARPPDPVVVKVDARRSGLLRDVSVQVIGSVAASLVLLVGAAVWAIFFR